MKFIYEYYNEELLKSNYFESHKKLNKTWYEGTTNLLPVNIVIKQTLNLGYMNHIQRLMIVMNTMILNEIEPKEMYIWFMEMSIDSYDWVMVSNIYGMGFASKKFMTRPYISSSNYITKMMFPKLNGSAETKWKETWDIMYRSFVCKMVDKGKSIMNYYSKSKC
jgi:deoxyribodipyrimidine photolyase-related protein